MTTRFLYLRSNLNTPPRVTVAFRVEGNNIRWAYATRMPNDPWNRLLGRTIAEGRLNSLHVNMQENAQENLLTGADCDSKPFDIQLLEHLMYCKMPVKTARCSQTVRKLAFKTWALREEARKLRTSQSDLPL